MPQFQYARYVRQHNSPKIAATARRTQSAQRARNAFAGSTACIGVMVRTILYANLVVLDVLTVETQALATKLKSITSFTMVLLCPHVHLGLLTTMVYVGIVTGHVAIVMDRISKIVLNVHLHQCFLTADVSTRVFSEIINTGGSSDHHLVVCVPTVYRLAIFVVLQTTALHVKENCSSGRSDAMHTAHPELIKMIQSVSHVPLAVPPVMLRGAVHFVWRACICRAANAILHATLDHLDREQRFDS